MEMVQKEKADETAELEVLDEGLDGDDMNLDRDMCCWVSLFPVRA